MLVPVGQITLLILLFFILSIICLCMPVVALQGFFMVPLHTMFLLFSYCHRLSLEAIYSRLVNPYMSVLALIDKVDTVNVTVFFVCGILYPFLVYTQTLDIFAFSINLAAFILQGCLMSINKTFFSVLNTLLHGILIPYAFIHDDKWLPLLILSMTLMKLSMVDQLIAKSNNKWSYRFLHVTLLFLETGQMTGFMYLYWSKMHRELLTDATIEQAPKSLRIFFSNMQSAVYRRMQE